MKFVNGTHLWARRGETGVTGNIYYGLHEFEDMAFVAHALRPGDLFADIGANAGSYTVIAAGVSGARVIAIEPVPKTIERLRANISLNSLDDHVRVEVCALTDKAGTVRFTTDQDTVNHVASATETAHTIDVPARTADALFVKDVPRIVKIDVEGHEFDLLRGASHMLSEPGVWAMIIEVSGVKTETVLATLSRHGFEPRKYDPFSRSLAPASPSVGAGNTLFLRIASEDDIASRLISAEPLVVHGAQI
ncbi:MAG: FkbM family methyltransferase [Proteobacteria bacterium]|nr:FkbM family methyltransferase [Pseudomonadota bacterium]MCH8951314.1 FkbM family methyltransferase [Pseudomonadota bacterium]